MEETLDMKKCLITGRVKIRDRKYHTILRKECLEREEGICDERSSFMMKEVHRSTLCSYLHKAVISM